MRGLGPVWFLVLVLLIPVATACTTGNDEPVPAVPSLDLFEVSTATPQPVATSTPVPTAVGRQQKWDTIRARNKREIGVFELPGIDSR